jgi:hypothetical protein
VLIEVGRELLVLILRYLFPEVLLLFLQRFHPNNYILPIHRLGLGIALQYNLLIMNTANREETPLQALIRNIDAQNERCAVLSKGNKRDF